MSFCLSRVSGVVVFVLLAGLLAGCGKDKPQDSSSKSGSGASTGQPKSLEDIREENRRAGEALAKEAGKAAAAAQVAVEYERQSFTIPKKPNTPAHTFSMEIPKGWTVTDQTSQGTGTRTLRIAHPVKDAASGMALWLLLSASEEADAQYVKNYMEAPETDTTKSEDERFEFGGFQARRIVLNSVYSNKAPKREIKFRLFKLPHMFGITATGPAAMADPHRGVLDHMIKSIQVGA